MSLELHPVAEIFPTLSEDEYQTLKAEIAREGQNTPCEVWNGKVIDGRHRLRVCEELGIEPKVQEWKGDESSMIRHVFGNSMARRSLSSSQKAAVVVEFDELLKAVEDRTEQKQKSGKSEDGQAGGRGNKKGNLTQKVEEGFQDRNDNLATEQIATLAGTNRQYVSDAKKLKEKAPEIFKKVKNGEMSMKGGVSALKREEAKQKKEKVEAEVKESTAEQSDLWRVEQGDCLSWLLSRPADSIDLVFGSPPYEMARLYLEEGEDRGIARSTDEWVAWMVDVYKAALKCCKGLVAFVVAGQTKKYRWTASPALLMADLHRAGICVRNPPLYCRVGIPGSGGPDWLRNDYEFIVCATRGGQLPWSDNTAMGHVPRYAPGGEPSHRTQDGSRVNSEPGYATMDDRNNVGPHRARQRAGRDYKPPEIANPGNIIDCVVGGGNMGDDLCHDNEAPFPEKLAEFFVRSFCPPNGLVCDPFSGSGTTGKMAVSYGRRFIGCDIRESQVELTKRRIATAQQVLPFEADK